MSVSSSSDGGETKSTDRSGPSRIAGVLRRLGEAGPGGARLSTLADATGLPAPTALRLLRALVAEDLVDLDPATKMYRLGLALQLQLPLKMSLAGRSWVSAPPR